MNETANKLAFFGALVVAAVTLPLLLGAGMQWPMWVRLALMAVALACVVGLGFRQLRQEPEPPVLARPPVLAPVAPAPPSQVALDPTPVPTAAPGYQVQVSATVLWRPTPGRRDGHGNPEALAKCAVVDRATSVARQFAPQDHVLFGHRLAADLGVPQVAGEGLITVWATDVIAAVGPADADRLATLDRLRKDAEVWKRRRDHEVDVRRYLSEDVLTSPGSAVVWWLARNIDEIEGTVERIGPLTRISAVAQGQTPEEHVDERVSTDASTAWGATDGREPVLTVGGGLDQETPPDAVLARNLLDALFPEPDRRRGVAVQQLARLAELWNRGDLADDIRRVEDALYDTPVYVHVDGDVTSEVVSPSDSAAVDDGRGSEHAVPGSQATDGDSGGSDRVEPRGPEPPHHDLEAWPEDGSQGRPDPDDPEGPMRT